MNRSVRGGRRTLLVTVAILQNVLVGGIVFGWAGISGTLLIAPTANGGAGLTMEQTTSIFAMAASTASFSSLLLGIVLDRFGPRIAAVVSNLIIGVGIQTMAMARSYPVFALGTCTVAFGGPGIQSSIVHLANLFPGNKFFVMSSINGSISLSFSIFPVFGILWEIYGFGIRPMFQSYTLVVAISTIASLVLWPDSPYESHDMELETLLLTDESNGGVEQNVEVSVEHFFLDSPNHTHLIEQPLDSFLRANSHHQLDHHDSFRLSRKSLEKGDLSLVSLKDLPFRYQLFSGSYARMVAIFICTFFFANFYIASITTEFADVARPLGEQRDLIQRFSLILSIGFFGSFLAGWLMDLVGLEACAMLTIFLGQVHMVILIFFSQRMTLMTIGFIVYTLFRQFLFPVFVACLSVRLGFKYFGILCGIGFAVSGLTQLGIAPLVHAVQGTCHVVVYEEDCHLGAWRQLHMLQLGLFFMLGVVPLWDHNAEVKRRNSALKGFASPSLSHSYGAVERSPPPVGAESNVGLEL